MTPAFLGDKTVIHMNCAFGVNRGIVGCGKTERIEESSTSIRSDEGLTLETSVFESFNGGQFTLLTHLINNIIF